MVGSGPILNSAKTLQLPLLPARMCNQSRVKALEWFDFSYAKGQLTPQSVVEFHRNSNSSKLLWLFSLPARMKKIHSKMKALDY